MWQFFNFSTIAKFFSKKEDIKIEQYNEYRFPHGRGFYIWRLNKCEGGDINKIIKRCHESQVTWLAIKCGDQGRSWKQFNSSVVNRFHDANIQVWGWSYDTPGDESHLQRQVDVAVKCVTDGARGFISNSEIEWKIDDADKIAKLYCEKLKKSLPVNAGLAHAPLDTIRFHQSFPYTEFGKVVDWVSPQAYWVGRPSVEISTNRYIEMWEKYEKNKPEAKKPRLPGGSSYGKATRNQCLTFEKMCVRNGSSAVLYWEYSQTHKSVWEGLKNNPFPE